MAELTGLANRTLFTEQLTRAIGRSQRKSTPLAALFIDLDRFKSVNDTLGHAAGDQVLRKVAEIIRSGHPDEEGKPRCNVPDEDRRRVYLWLDLNVPYYGTSTTTHQEWPGGRALRVPQLTAVLMLPLLLAFTWKVSDGARAWRRRAGSAA